MAINRRSDEENHPADKSTMNLAACESRFPFRQLLPAVVLVAVFAALLVKFGILDQNARRSEAYRALAEKQAQLDDLNAQLAGYDALVEQRSRYGDARLTPEEAALADRAHALTLVEEALARSPSVVENFALNGNILTANLHGITLQQAQTIVASLESDPKVENVSVYSAAAGSSQKASVFLTVTLFDSTKEGAPDERP